MFIDNVYFHFQSTLYSIQFLEQWPIKIENMFSCFLSCQSLGIVQTAYNIREPL